MRKVVLRVDRKHSALENASVILDQGKQQALFIVLFTILYLIRDLTYIRVPEIAFSGLCAVAFLLTDVGTSLGIYMFTSALTLPHNEIRFLYLAIVSAKIFFSGVVRINRRMMLITLGIFFLQLLNMTVFSADSVGNVVYKYATKMLFFTLPLIWYNEMYTEEDFRSALICYVAGVMLGGTITMILTAERITWEVLLKGQRGYRLGYTYAAESDGMTTTYNANQLGTMFSIVSAILIQFMEQKRMPKLLGFSLLGYSLFLIILTRSRTALLTLGMAFVIYYLVLVIRKKRIFGGFAILGAASLLLFAVVRLFPEVADAAFGRFVDQEDITNGRTDIFIYYIYKWIETPWCFFFGYGIGSFFDELGVNMSPHNAVTDILISWGLTGMLLIGGTIFMCYKNGIRNVKKSDRIIALLPALVALVASMAGQYLTTGFPHVRLCFLFLAAGAVAQADVKPKAIGREIKNG